MKVTLDNGVKLSPITATGSVKVIQGQARDSIEFVFPGDTSLQELDEVFTEDGCERIIIDDTYIHYGYTIKGGVRKECVITSAETIDSTVQFEDRIFVVMGQRTYTENQLAKIKAAQIEQDEMIAELLFGAEYMAELDTEEE